MAFNQVSYSLRHTKFVGTLACAIGEMRVQLWAGVKLPEMCGELRYDLRAGAPVCGNGDAAATVYCHPRAAEIECDDR